MKYKNMHDLVDCQDLKNSRLIIVLTKNDCMDKKNIKLDDFISLFFKDKLEEKSSFFMLDLLDLLDSNLILTFVKENLNKFTTLEGIKPAINVLIKRADYEIISEIESYVNIDRMSLSKIGHNLSYTYLLNFLSKKPEGNKELCEDLLNNILKKEISLEIEENYELNALTIIESISNCKKNFNEINLTAIKNNYFNIQNNLLGVTTTAVIVSTLVDLYIKKFDEYLKSNHKTELLIFKNDESYEKLVPMINLSKKDIINAQIDLSQKYGLKNEYIIRDYINLTTEFLEKLNIKCIEKENSYMFISINPFIDNSDNWQREFSKFIENIYMKKCLKELMEMSVEDIEDNIEKIVQEAIIEPVKKKANLRKF